MKTVRTHVLLLLFVFCFVTQAQPAMAGDERANYSTELVQFDCGTVTEIPATECDALVALYNSTNGSGWTENSGWLETNTPCSWFGMTCGSGQIRVISLAENQLSGTIPAQLGNLSQLTFLDLDGNQLIGSIPPELGNLNLLTDLFLSWNQLSGTIPSELVQLSNLEWLWLQRNQLTGALPTNIGLLSKLEDLRLNGNPLSGELPQSITALNLSEFDYSQTQICTPADEAMQNWLTTIGELARSGDTCSEGQNSLQLNLSVYLPFIE